MCTQCWAKTFCGNQNTHRPKDHIQSGAHKHSSTLCTTSAHTLTRDHCDMRSLTCIHTGILLSAGRWWDSCFQLFHALFHDRQTFLPANTVIFSQSNITTGWVKRCHTPYNCLTHPVKLAFSASTGFFRILFSLITLNQLKENNFLLLLPCRGVVCNPLFLEFT